MICTKCGQEGEFYAWNGKTVKPCTKCLKAYQRKRYTPTGRRAGRPKKKEKVFVERGLPYGVPPEFRLFAMMPAASATLRATPDLPPAPATA